MKKIMSKYHINCYLCDSENIKPLKGYKNKGLVKCNNCGLVFMSQIPTAEELHTYYSAYSYGREQYLSPITVKSFNKILDEFEKYRKTNKILDVGCGLGYFLSIALQRGWEVYGTEYSLVAVDKCTSKGIIMYEGDLKTENYEPEEFDIVTSFEVLEHINNPKIELNKFYSILRKGGLFYCTTPNFNSLNRYYSKEKYNNICYPEHLTYYTQKTLNKVVVESGFKKIKNLTTGISLTSAKVSNSKSNEQQISKTSSDEKLREQIDTKWYLGVAKIIINKLLTFTNLGITLKGYYLKK